MAALLVYISFKEYFKRRMVVVLQFCEISSQILIRRNVKSQNFLWNGISYFYLSQCQISLWKVISFQMEALHGWIPYFGIDSLLKISCDSFQCWNTLAMLLPHLIAVKETLWLKFHPNGQQDVTHRPLFLDSSVIHFSEYFLFHFMD